jgi:putative ABC transport system permease protein
MISLAELAVSTEIGLIFGIVSVGIYLTFRTVNFTDMTCDGSFVLGSAVSAISIKSGFNPYLACLLSMASGVISGLFTSLLNIKFKISDLLSGIIVSFMLYSINLRIMGGSPNIILSSKATVFSNQSFQNFAILVALICGLVYLLRGKFGLKLRAIGYNKTFSAVSGINVKFMTAAGVALSNSLISLGGGLFTQYQGFCDVSQGLGTLITSLASVVIGERILPFKKEPLLIISCVIGSVVYRMFVSAAMNVNVCCINAQDLNLITGTIIILTMLLRKNREKC